MGGFEGISYSHSSSSEGVSVRLSQAEFEKFQARQGSSVSIGESGGSLRGQLGFMSSWDELYILSLGSWVYVSLASMLFNNIQYWGITVNCLSRKYLNNGLGQTSINS